MRFCGDEPKRCNDVRVQKLNEHIFKLAVGAHVGVAGGAIEVAAGSDEAAIVVVPVVAVFLIGCVIIFGAGALVLAFSYATARTAVRVTREGWASAAVRLTWKPLAGAVLCAVALGATIDHFIPTAQSLPQALRALRH